MGGVDANPPTAGDEADQTMEYIVGFYELPDNRNTYQGEPVTFVAEDLTYFVVETDEPVRFTAQTELDDRVRYYEDNDNDYTLAYTPDDSRYPDQYGPQITNTESAWDTTLGATSVKIGLLDSGINADHEDFVSSRVSGDNYVGGSGIGDVDKCGYHGSHTSGTAAATTDNGVGIAGMSESSIVMHKIFKKGGGPGGCGSADTSDIAQALKDLGDKGAHVSSNSWGGGGNSTAINDAIDYAHDKGTIHVAAAGNDGPCTDCIGQPWEARPGKVITITCSDASDAFCSFSSQGPEADIIAPGDSVLSVDGGTTSGYTNKDGTSMSTPHVSGAIGLYVDANGDDDYDTVRQALGDSADDLGLSENRQGDGRLNTGDFVGSGSGPTADFTYDCTELNCTFNGSASSGDIDSYDWEFGDGNTGVGKVVDHSYAESGTYTVNLTVTNATGSTDTESKDVTVSDGSTDQLLFDGFEDGDLSPWTEDGSNSYWRIADDCKSVYNGSWMLSFSISSSCDYDDGNTVQGHVTSETIDSSGYATVTLNFTHFFEVEDYNGEYDVMQVQVSDDGGSSWNVVKQWDARDHTNSDWTPREFDISSYASSNMQIRYEFDSVDSVDNDQLGWYIDDVQVIGS